MRLNGVAVAKFAGRPRRREDWDQWFEVHADDTVRRHDPGA